MISNAFLALSTASFLPPTEQVTSHCDVFSTRPTNPSILIPKYMLAMAITNHRPLTLSIHPLFSSIVSPQQSADCHAIATATAAQAYLDRTIFRASLLNDNDADLALWAELLEPIFRGTSYLNRGGLARWVLDEMERNWVRKALALGN
jgi:hypothetical protein